MAKKLNSMPDYQARMPRHPHDLGQSFTFTSAPAMELPVYYDMLHLGDKIHFSGNMFARLNPLSVATLGEIDIHLDYFFVPLSVMYTPAPSLFYQTDDLVSSLIYKDMLNKDSFPLVNIGGSMYASLLDGGSLDYSKPDSLFANNLSLDTLFFDCKAKAIVRLCDMLRFDYSAVFAEQYQTSNPNITPWFLLAYHACHQLYFRNDDREVRNYQLYNIDTLYDTSSPVSDSRAQGLWHLNYVSAYKDYFNAVKVSPVGSSVSMLGSSSWDLLSKVNSYLFDGVYRRTDESGSSDASFSDSVNTTVRGFSARDTSDLANRSFTAANIRQLFMVDKLLRVTGRANKDYESQFLAHFGIKIPHDVLHNITHIGHDMATIKPSPVISSANTFDSATGAGSALGEIGGQGYVGFSGKKRSFEAPCHGVFMVIYHAIPKFRYLLGIDKLHDLSSPDKFWQPEYDRKGMQPVFGYEYLPANGVVSSYRVGWQFAYEQFKRKVDRVSIAFGYPRSNTSVNEYSPWVLSRIPYHVPYQNLPIAGSIQGTPNIDVRSFLATPHDLDGIMQVTYQSAWIQGLNLSNVYELFVTDPLINDFRMDCKKVNFMSEYGEPELD